MKEKIDNLKLENGFNCCFRKISFYQGFVTMALTVKVGSAVEDKGKKGIAHLLEHLLMSFLTFDLYHDVRYRAKAYTDFNETIYYIKCPADENNFKTILKIVYGIAQGEFIDDQYFERAKDDVLREIREEQKNKSIVKILLKQSEYLSYLAMGNEDDVLKLRYEDVKNFFEQYYSANIMSLAIVGDISAEIKNYAIDLFTNLNCVPHITDRKTFLIPDYKNEIEYVNIFKEKVDNSELNIIFKMRKEISESKEDTVRAEIVERIALDLLSVALENSLNQRELEIEYEHKELDNFYTFYMVKIKTKKLDKKNLQILVSEIINFFNNPLTQNMGDVIIYELLEQFYKIERDEEVYYRKMGIHQQLLECIDNFISQNPIMTYEERCLLYEKKSKEINKDEIYMFLEALKREGKMFIAYL